GRHPARGDGSGAGIGVAVVAVLAGAVAHRAPSAGAGGAAVRASTQRRHRGLRSRPRDEVRGDLLDETRRREVLGGAKARAHLCTREVQALASASEAHVGEAALLLHLARPTILKHASVREGAVLETGEEDN